MCTLFHAYYSVSTLTDAHLLKPINGDSRKRWRPLVNVNSVCTLTTRQDGMPTRRDGLPTTRDDVCTQKCDNQRTCTCLYDIIKVCALSRTPMLPTEYVQCLRWMYIISLCIYVDDWAPADTRTWPGIF